MKYILVLGDSHTSVFNYCNYKSDCFYFDVLSIPGASASGCLNPGRKVDIVNTFHRKIMGQKYDYILVMLGEKDCGFGIWNKKIKNDIPIEESLKKSVNTLFEFVEKNLLGLYKPQEIIIAGVMLPALGNFISEKYIGKRALINADKMERTNITLIYNLMLRQRCQQMDLKYMDITNSILDGKKRLVNEYFLKSDKYDFHLNDSKTSEFWLKEIEKLR